MGGLAPAPPAAVRRERMLRLIKSREFARVAELSDEFGISEVTVRADLDLLERRGSIRRVHGGAVPHDHKSRVEPTFEEALGDNAGEKEAIGRVAAEMVNPGDTIIIDVGTTAAALAAALIDRDDLGSAVIITNSLNIALQFENAMPPFAVVVTGGTLRPQQHSLVEPYADLVLGELFADLFFVGCNGIHPAAGVTNINLPEAQMKRRMMASSRRTVILADGSKIGEISTARVAPIDQFELLITGPSAPELALQELADVGMRYEITPSNKQEGEFR